MKAKSLKPALVLLLNLITPLIDKFLIPMETTTALWIFSIGIVFTILILTIWFIVNSETKTENDLKEKQKRKELEEILLLMLSKNPPLFYEYMNKLKERKYYILDKEWDFFAELDEIDRINKIPRTSK